MTVCFLTPASVHPFQSLPGQYSFPMLAVQDQVNGVLIVTFLVDGVYTGRHEETHCHMCVSDFSWKIKVTLKL